MSEYIFDQLAFARNATLAAAKDLSESEADFVPQGLNNNIRWNLGHIYLIQERFALQFAQEPTEVPEGFADLFASGTKPAEWKTQAPTLAELVKLLTEQPQRIREKLTNRLTEKVANPLTIGSLKLDTIGALLTFSLLHEGMHQQNIKNLRKLSGK
ncbi:MAG TPA: DinB family protein [Desulfobacteria bacterium]|nr:DinB family protein [Desulfobacteria bacterium]